MTNFEKIKQMSVEEIAKAMVNGKIYFINDLCEKENHNTGLCKYCRLYEQDNCRYVLTKQWLESEVETK